MLAPIRADDPAATATLFTAEGCEELIPPPAFDYRSYRLDVEEAIDKLTLLIDGMTKVEDKTGRWVYQRGSRWTCCAEA